MTSRLTHPTLGRKLGSMRLTGQNGKADYDDCPSVRRSKTRLPKIRLLVGSAPFLSTPDLGVLTVYSVTAMPGLSKLVSRTYKHCQCRTAIQQNSTTKVPSLVTVMVRTCDAMNV